MESAPVVEQFLECFDTCLVAIEDSGQAHSNELAVGRCDREDLATDERSSSNGSSIQTDRKWDVEQLHGSSSE